MKSVKVVEPQQGSDAESSAAKVVPIAPRPLLITPTSAAQELSISRAQVYRMARNGSLPYVKVGTRIRIPFAALVKIAAGNTTPEQQSV